MCGDSTTTLVVFFFHVVDDKVVYEEHGFGIHRHKDVIFKLGDKAAVYNWLRIYTTTEHISAVSNSHISIIQCVLSTRWRFGLVVMHWPRSTKLLYAGPVSTGMGDHVRNSTPSSEKSISGQLNLAIPPWVGAMSTSDGYDHC